MLTYSLRLLRSKILSLQQDFKNQKGKLEEEVERRGHLVAFYPKFHCELNWIEYYWGNAKQFTRDHCEYNVEALRRVIPEALSSILPKTIRAYFARCQRRMEAYRMGITYGTEEFRKYTSHRRVRTDEDGI
jgi:hypothetical protein